MLRSVECGLKIKNMTKSYLKQGNQLKRKGQIAEAATFYAKAIERTPYLSWPYYCLGEVLVKMDKLDEAIANYQKAISLNPCSAWFYFDLGKVLAKQNKTDEAIDKYQKAVQVNSDLHPTYYSLGEAFSGRKKWAEAEIHYRKAIKIFPKQSYYHFSLGKVLIEQKKIAEAAIAYKNAIENKPDFFEAYHKLAGTLQGMNKFDEAIINYRKAVEINPKFFHSYHCLGDVFNKQGNLAKAITNYQKAIDVNPNFYWSYHHLGHIFMQTNQLDGAIDSFSKSIEIFPSFLPGNFNLGKALEVKGCVEEAIKYYLKAIEIEPKFEEPYFRLSQLLENKGKLEEASSYCRNLIEVNPNSHKAYLRLAQSLEKQHKVNEAIIWYQKYMEVKPDQTDVYINEHPINISLKEKAFTSNSIATKSVKPPKIKRLILAEEIFWLIYSVAILKYQESTKEYGECEDFLVTYRSCNPQTTKHFIELTQVWDFQKITSIQGILTLYRNQSISLSTAAELIVKQVGAKNVDVIYVHNFFRTSEQLILAAYPHAKVVAIPDGYGAIGTSQYSSSSQLDSAYLVVPLEIGKNTFKRIKKTEYIEFKLLSEVISQCSNLVPDIKNSQSKVGETFNGFSESPNTICLIVYYSRLVKEMTFEEEIELYLSHILSYTSADEIIWLKEHPAHNYGQSSALAKKLEEHGRRCVEMKQLDAANNFLNLLPMEFFIPFLNISKAITFDSAGCVALAYLSKCDIVLGCDPNFIQKYLPPPCQYRLVAYKIQVEQAYKGNFQPVFYSQVDEMKHSLNSFPVHLSYNSNLPQ